MQTKNSIKKSPNEGAYTSRSCHILQYRAKVAIAPKCLEEEGFQYKNIARDHGNIDIILILEKSSISLLPSNHREGKRAQAFLRCIWVIFQEFNSLPSHRIRNE